LVTRDGGHAAQPARRRAADRAQHVQRDDLAAPQAHPIPPGRTRTTRTITAPALLFLGGQDAAVGSATAAASRARGTIARCQIEILPKAGHLMIFDEPDFIGGRTAEFLGDA
jgi:pimeloyl-ACP methyl ester carboxylesterase